MLRKNDYVLMVEDDKDDRYITETTLVELGFNIPIRFLSYSDELIPNISGSEKPAIILLNYNAIPITCIDLLRQLKANPVLCHIPVIILSESASSQYVTECYQAGANTFIKKPSISSLVTSKIEVFFKYWFEVAELMSPQ